MALARLINVGSAATPGTEPENVVPIANIAHFVQIDLNYLVADLKTPCRIFLYNGEQIWKVYETNENIPLHDIPRIRIEFFSIGFIAQADFNIWEQWVRSRQSNTSRLEILTEKTSFLEERKIKPQQSNINTYLSYAFETIQIRMNCEADENKRGLCNSYFRGIVENKSIEWYFIKRQPDALFQHSARVSYLTLLFASFALPKMPLEALEILLLSAIIHELEGDISDRSGKTTSLQTLEKLKCLNHPLPEKVIDLIRQHDETYDGRGAPQNLAGDKISVLARIFCFTNRFDHTYAATQGASRRVRMEQMLAKLAENQSMFDPKLSKLFFAFISRIEVIE